MPRLTRQLQEYRERLGPRARLSANVTVKNGEGEIKTTTSKPPILLYLTLDDDPPNDGNFWTNVLWQDCVLTPLSAIVSSDFLRSTMGVPQQHFVQSYVKSLLAIYSLPGDRVEKLTQDLLNKHPTAIESLAKIKTNVATTDNNLKAIQQRHSNLLTHLTSCYEDEITRRARAIREQLSQAKFTVFGNNRTYIPFMPEVLSKTECPKLYSEDPDQVGPLVYFEVINRHGSEPSMKLTFSAFDGESSDEGQRFRNQLWNTLGKLDKGNSTGNWRGFDKVKHKYQTVFSVRDVWDKASGKFNAGVSPALSTVSEAAVRLKTAYQQLTENPAPEGPSS